MIVKKLTELSAHQVKNVLELVEECRTIEETTVSPTLTSSINFNPDVPCLFLGEEKGYLLSFVSIFMPNPNYAEVVGFTSPAARQRGFFMQCWLEALKVLGPKYPDMQFYFLTDGKSPSALACFKALQMNYKYTEFVMDHPITHKDQRFRISVQELDGKNDADSNAIFMMHTNMFEYEDRGEVKAFMESTMADYANNYLVRNEESTPIGLFHIAVDGDRAFLFGLGVMPQYRRRGYGRQMVQMALNLCDEPIKALGLQVSSLNEPACNLYRSCGFREVNRLDYYHDPIEEF